MTQGDGQGRCLETTQRENIPSTSQGNAGDVLSQLLGTLPGDDAEGFGGVGGCGEMTQRGQRRGAGRPSAAIRRPSTADKSQLFIYCPASG